jgi:cell division protein FtsW
MVTTKRRTHKRTSGKPSDWWHFDRGLLVGVLLLLGFGLVMLYSASSATAFRDFGDRWYYVKYQVVWMIAGFTGLFLLQAIDYHLLLRYALLILSLIVVLLVLVLIPGIGVKLLGARRWINIAGFSLQPSEAIKLSLVLYLTARFKKSPVLVPLLAVLGILGLLLILQPDMGTTIVVILTGLVMYFLAGASLLNLAMIVPGLAILSVLAIIISPYRRERLLTFFNHQSDPLGSAYQIRQAVLAIGSGGLFGLGLGQSRQKFSFLPEVTTDSIFAIVAEELGFAGSLFLLGLFVWLLVRGVSIALKAPDREGMLLASGITMLIFIQVIVNLGAITALLPLTGVPLPFISSGGSSLIMTLLGIGILLNISRQS